MSSYRDLKPCPFCGRAPYITYINIPASCGPDLDIWTIHCTPCKLRKLSEGGTMADAVKRWNKRAEVET